MREAFIGLAAVLAIVTAGHAQESFFNKRYCTMGGSDNSGGMADCSYNTWEQCRASASGLARYCAENPNWRPEGAGGSAQPQRGKKGKL